MELNGWLCPRNSKWYWKETKKVPEHSMLNETLLWMLIGMATKTFVNYNKNYLSMQINHNEAWYELI